MKWLLVALFTTAAAFAAGQNASLPDGDGKAIVSASCVSCHGLDLITPKKATRNDWAAIVDRMKTYGVNLDDKQTTVVVDYLAKSFPPAGAAPAPAPATPAAPAATDQAAVDAAGKAAVDQLCGSCHGLDLITSKQASRVDWQSTIDRMKSYGASIDDKQNAILIEYLVKTQGPKEQAAVATTPGAPDPGKAIFEGSCGSCHDLDLTTQRTGTQQDWQDIVDRMNGRGAGVAEKDVPVLVAYLAKTYPVKTN